jgi:pimeloyl-ACP methyl ester carboxylesterase
MLEQGHFAVAGKGIQSNRGTDSSHVIVGRHRGHAAPVEREYRANRSGRPFVWRCSHHGRRNRNSHVKALVYITAFGLDEGESLDSLSKQGPPSPGSRSIEPDKDGFLWINREKFHKSFAADATSDEASVMAAVQRPLSFASFSEAEGTAAWKTIPSWYLVCSDDQMIPPPAQEFLAERMNATVRSVPSSHAPFMSHPQEVADIIALAAGAMTNQATQPIANQMALIETAS